MWKTGYQFSIQNRPYFSLCWVLNLHFFIVSLVFLTNTHILTSSVYLLPLTFLRPISIWPLILFCRVKLLWHLTFFMSLAACFFICNLFDPTLSYFLQVLRPLIFLVICISYNTHLLTSLACLMTSNFLTIRIGFCCCPLS